MKSRGLVVVLALLLATVATAGVFLYTQGVKKDVRNGGEVVPVIVSKVDIPANSDLDSFIKASDFTVIEVSKDAVPAGAVSDITQLQAKHNNSEILANEIIPLARLQGTGRALGIAKGYEAMTVSLDSWRALSGTIAAGDMVNIYGTFTDLKTVKVDKHFNPVGNQSSNLGIDTTVVLVEEAKVLGVLLPTTPGGVNEQNVQQLGAVAVTLQLTPQQMQRVVFGMEEGKVWLGLFPPDATAPHLVPLTAGSLLLGAKGK